MQNSSGLQIKRGIGFQADALLAPGQALTHFMARAGIRPPQIEEIAIDCALGRTLAQRAIADAAYPAAPRSAMDGFAVRSSDTPGRLCVAGEIRMGTIRQAALEPGTAVRIPTGGMLPAGADAVVPIEDAVVCDDSVTVAASISKGEGVTPAGSDMRAGEVLLEPGCRIAPPELAVLATLGFASVPVFRKPFAGVISSGDELVDVAAKPEPGQIRDSNRWAVGGALEAMGAVVRHFPIARDDAAELEKIVREALEVCDAVFLTGGSSVGERDLTPEIIARLGSPGVIVHGLRVKPGKPTVLASIEGKPVIGLPGNPTSALMILETIGAPIVAAMTGARQMRHETQAYLGESLRKRPGWTWFVPVRLDEAGATPRAYPLELRSSSASLLARASGFVELAETIEELAADTPVRVVRFVGR